MPNKSPYARRCCPCTARSARRSGSSRSGSRCRTASGFGARRLRAIFRKLLLENLSRIARIWLGHGPGADSRPRTPSTMTMTATTMSCARHALQRPRALLPVLGRGPSDHLHARRLRLQYLRLQHVSFVVKGSRFGTLKLVAAHFVRRHMNGDQ